MLCVLLYLLSKFPWPVTVNVADAYACGLAVPALQDSDVSLSGRLAVIEAQRNLEASVIDLVLDVEADNSEGVVKDCGMEEPIVYRCVFEKYLHGVIVCLIDVCS